MLNYIFTLTSLLGGKLVGVIASIVSSIVGLALIVWGVWYVLKHKDKVQTNMNEFSDDLKNTIDKTVDTKDEDNKK